MILTEPQLYAYRVVCTYVLLAESSEDALDAVTEYGPEVLRRSKVERIEVPQ